MKRRNHDAAAGARTARVQPGTWQLLPLRFHRFGPGEVLLTNLVGEHVRAEDQFLAVLDGTCDDQRCLLGCGPGT